MKKLPLSELLDESFVNALLTDWQGYAIARAEIADQLIGEAGAEQLCSVLRLEDGDKWVLAAWLDWVTHRATAKLPGMVRDILGYHASLVARGKGYGATKATARAYGVSVATVKGYLSTYG